MLDTSNVIRQLHLYISQRRMLWNAALSRLTAITLYGETTRDFQAVSLMSSRAVYALALIWFSLDPLQPGYGPSDNINTRLGFVAVCP